jgi:hypothetical protein
MNAALGMWLSLAAALFAHDGSATITNNVFLGLSIFLVSFLAMGVDTFRRVNLVLGIWAVLSPFLLGYMNTGAAVNDMVVGILVVWVSLWGPRKTGGRSGRLAASHVSRA